MAVKIIIKRIVPEEKVKNLTPLLKQLRALATNQPGYISGETLKRVDNPGEYLVISMWESAGEWDRWILSEERKAVQDKIDILLGKKTEYEVYTY
ncbi:MAG: antibiotic biosynthesis monooxygenase family protein [Desulfobacterales bacterium]|jgi:heme-degrading monooxygenase HmoA|nr:antibiotic biosynthesis monooxygenase family protein [Desulfobacterales bacterium]